MAVGGAFFRKGRRLPSGHVFEPISGLARSPGTYIHGDIGLAADLIDEIHEFVRAKRVRLDHAAPVWIESHSAVLASAVTPVIFICKAASRPANIGNPNGLQRGHNVVANAASVRDLRIRPNPNAVVNPMPKMLGKLAEDVPI